MCFVFTLYNELQVFGDWRVGANATLVRPSVLVADTRHLEVPVPWVRMIHAVPVRVVDLGADAQRSTIFIQPHHLYTYNANVTDSLFTTTDLYIYKYLDTGLLFPSVAIFDHVKLTSSALTHAHQPNLSSIYRSVASCGIGLYARKFQDEITVGRRAHVRKMFVSLTHSPDSAYNTHKCNKV